MRQYYSRASFTALCRGHSLIWSFTSPADCIYAYTTVGPMKEKPRFFMSRAMASARGVLAGTSVHWALIDSRSQHGSIAAHLIMVGSAR